LIGLDGQGLAARCAIGTSDGEGALHPGSPNKLDVTRVSFVGDQTRRILAAG